MAKVVSDLRLLALVKIIWCLHCAFLGLYLFRAKNGWKKGRAGRSRRLRYHILGGIKAGGGRRRKGKGKMGVWDNTRGLQKLISVFLCQLMLLADWRLGSVKTADVGYV